VGECFFWYRPTRVVPVKRPLNGKNKNAPHSRQITTLTPHQSIFTGCYASAVLAMGLCLSVSVSVTSRCSVKAAGRIELVFGI